MKHTLPTSLAALALILLSGACTAAPAPAPASTAPAATPTPVATPTVAVSTPPMPKTPDPVAVQVEAKTTAYLVLDLTETTCGANPRCVEIVPNAAALLKKARDAGSLVVYSKGRAPTNVLPALLPAPDDPVVSSAADKFFGTTLDDTLKAKGIKTVVMVGTAPNGAVLYTAFGASLRGYSVVVADDGMPADAVPLAITRWQLLNQPGFSNPENKALQPNAVTLSKTTLITFK